MPLNPNDSPLRSGSPFDEYRQNEAITDNPTEILIKVYDIAIESCDRQDMDRARRALVELIAALNFDHREVADNLYNLYRYALDQIHKSNFDGAKEILIGLRETWKETLKKPA